MCPESEIRDNPIFVKKLRSFETWNFALEGGSKYGPLYICGQNAFRFMCTVSRTVSKEITPKLDPMFTNYFHNHLPIIHFTKLHGIIKISLNFSG